MGVGYPEEHGGSGGGSLAFGVFIEELVPGLGRASRSPRSCPSSA